MQHEGWLIVMEDCLDALRAIPAEVDVIPTSPPYNIGMGYNRHNDRMLRETYLTWLSERFAEIYRVLKRDGSFFLNIGTGTQEDPRLPHDIIGCVLPAGFVKQTISHGSKWTRSTVSSAGTSSR
jgi:site-specific DNA-methyltransferase (adenine-specific)